MIKNIVFDIGNVLFDFKPKEYILKFGYDKKISDFLEEIIFKSKFWIESDRGRYTIDNLRDILTNENSEYSKQINEVLKPDWVKMHVIKPESIEYLKYIKEKGYKVYLLSNISKEAYEYISSFEFFKIIDGGTYSYQINICKPQKDIYLDLLGKYDLSANETIFIDDNVNNIKTANNLGIHGIVFNELEQVKNEVELILNKNN